MKRSSKWILTFLAFLTLLGAGTGLAGASSGNGFLKAFNSAERHDPPLPFPPDISFSDMQGADSALAAYAGKTVLVNFWATWCAPCITEMPGLLALRERTKDRDDFVLLLVSMDYPENPQALKEKMARLGIEAPDTLYAKDVKIWEVAGSKGLPASLILNSKGEIMYTLTGDNKWDSPGALDFIISVLDEKL